MSSYTPDNLTTQLFNYPIANLGIPHLLYQRSYVVKSNSQWESPKTSPKGTTWTYTHKDPGMKCTNCGFPLSPTHTNMPCPRCHSSTTSNPGLAVQQQIQNQIPFPSAEQAPFSQPDQAWQASPAHTPMNMQAT